VCVFVCVMCECVCVMCECVCLCVCLCVYSLFASGDLSFNPQTEMQFGYLLEFVRETKMLSGNIDHFSQVLHFKEFR